MWLLLLTCLALLLLYGMLTREVPAGVPQPGFCWPFIGHWLTIRMQSKRNSLRWFWHTAQRFNNGPWAFWLPGLSTLVVTLDARDVQYVLQTGHHRFRRHPRSSVYVHVW